MGDLGQYKVVVSADYSAFLASIDAVIKSVQTSADQIVSKMNAMTDSVGKSLNELSATVKNVSLQSGSIDSLVNATDKAGKTADTVTQKYKTLQAQVREAAKNADKAWQSGSGFSERKKDYEEALKRLVEYKKELGTLSSLRERERALQEEQKIRKAIEDAKVKDYNKYLVAEEKIQAAMNERERLQELAQTKAYEKHVALKEKALQKELAMRERALQEEQKIRMAIEKVNEGKFQKEQAEIQRLAQQYDNLYRRVASYIDSNTKLSAQAFTKTNADLELLAKKMATKGATPINQNPLAQFANYEQYASGFDKISNSIKKTANETSILNSVLDKARSHLLWIAGAAVVAAPGFMIHSLAKIEQQMAGMIQTLPELHHNQAALNSVSKQFIGIAEQYGMEVDKIIEAGKLWSRGYKDVGEVMALTSLSAKLAVADMMDVGLANRAVESVINSYGRQADAVSFATHVVDSWTNIAHNTQASATDLAEALMRSAAAAHVVGISFDTATALAATMLKTTGQAGGIVGNALKSIFSSIHSEKAVKDLQELGIEVYKFDKDGTAHFRNLAEVITDLMLTTHETSKNMQEDLEHVAGGKFQWGRAAALFGNYADFIKAYNLSINSSGFTEGQIAAQMDTISRKAQQVKTSFEGLLTGAGYSGLSQAIKSVLDVVNSLIKGLQQVPSTMYKFAGALIAGYAALMSISVITGAVSAGINGLKTSYAQLTISKTMDTAAQTANNVAQATGAVVTRNLTSSLAMETAGMTANTIATNANTAAKSRLALITTAATGGFNLLFAAITAAIVGTTVYSAALGKTETDMQNTIQKNEDLIAAKKQELEMNQKQVEFISTLGQAYIRLKQDQETYKDDAEKLKQINTDLVATEEELTKIIGKDGLERIKTSEDVNAAITREQEVHEEKGKGIKTALDNLVIAQKELRDNTIKYCNDRIDAINNEAISFDKAAGAIEQALGRIQRMWFEYYRGKADFMGKQAEKVKKELHGGTLETAWKLAGIPTDNINNSADKIVESLERQKEEYNQKADEIANAAKQVAINQMQGALNLGSQWHPPSGGNKIGGTETTPSGGSGSGGSGMTEYEQRKKEFEAANAKAKFDKEKGGEKYTYDDELALWRQYMSEVTKIDDEHHQETLDYQKREFELSDKALRENLDLRQAQIERAIAEEKITKLAAYEEEIKQIDEKAKHALKGSVEYENILKKKAETEKQYADYLTSIAKKEAEINKQYLADMQEINEKAAEFAQKIGLISKEQMLANKSMSIQNTYQDEQAGIQKYLKDTAKPGNEDAMIAAYHRLLAAKTETEQQAEMNTMISLSKQETATLDFIQKGLQSYTSYCEKRKELEKDVFEYTNRYQLAAANAFQSSVESALEGILNRTMTFGQGLIGIVRSIVTAIARQWITNMAAKWTQMLKQRLLSEQVAANQSVTIEMFAGQAKTAVAAANNASQVAAEQAKSATIISVNTATNQIVITQSKAAAASVTASIGATIKALLPMLAIMMVLGALFGGGGNSTSTSTSAVSLGRSPASYYSVPSAVPQITVPSFDTGAEMLPEDMLAYVHKGEMILTPELADNIRSLGSNGGVVNQVQQKPVVVNNNINASAIDGRGMKQALYSSSRDVANTIRREVRRFNTSLNGKTV